MLCGVTTVRETVLRIALWDFTMVRPTVLSLLFVLVLVPNRGALARPEKGGELHFSSESQLRELKRLGGESHSSSSEGGQGFVCVRDVGAPCGDGDHCCCVGNMAYCNGQQLTHIPALPHNITRLDFSNNSMTYIGRHAFENLTSLTYLNLERNGIKSVHHDAFSELTQLTKLHLGTNNLTSFGDLVSALKPCRSLEDLNVSANLFQNFTLSSLSQLPALRSLLLYANSISTVEKGAWKNESSLQVLDLGSNFLNSFPEFCRDDEPGESILPHLSSLNVEWNIITALVPPWGQCLPALKNLSLSGNAIHHLQANFLRGIPTLRRFALQFCMSKAIDGHAFNHPNLTQLDVSENLWFFDPKYGGDIHPLLFRDMPQLQFINMSWTVFRYSRFKERYTILRSLRHVSHFVLEGKPSVLRQ